MFRRTALLLVAVVLVPIVTSAAAIFPDVPDGHLFKADIESLVRLGIVHGNPDGKFYPERTVNRAEMLKMLYIAAGRTPDANAKECFSDVVKGSWYEAYVCDASKNKLVEGYAGGVFRPEKEVNRVEALKMIFSLLKLPAPEMTQADNDLLTFVDISTSAWYMRYISAAFKMGILPVAGQSGSRFGPDQILTRGEAAAYISSSLSADLTPDQSSSSSSSSSSFSSSSSSSVRDPALNKNVSFPFIDEGRFSEKKSVSYHFVLTEAKTTLNVQAKITGAITSFVTCRLYLINTEGFTEEYFLGVQEGGECHITVSARPGTYQLEIQPTAQNAYYLVSAQKTTGDGQDGFMEAVLLPKNSARTGVFTPHDTHDWYKFVVTEKMFGFVETSPSDTLECVIYTPLSIDQFGFSGPGCNENYEYAAGTYYVNIAHTPPLSKQQTYTIKFR